MTEMIERDYNHPCIIGWSVGNELRGHFNYVSNMLAFTRRLDPHRIVTHVSNSGSGARAHPTNDPITLGPIILYNTYSPKTDSAGILHERWPNQPIFFSEFGIGQFGAGLDRRIEGLEPFYDRLTAGRPHVIGASLWTFNDYRSDYKGTPASGNREWGIVTEDRQPKAAYEQLRKLFSPVRSLTVTNGVIRLEPRGPEDVPSFTLRGYKLKWDGGETTLPDLKPGDAAWTSDAKVKPGTIVKLFTPTGYDVADSVQ
jgi:beta-galactosidase